MKLNKTPNPLNRDARNKENENWDKLEKLNREVNNLVLESGGDSNLEVVQARGGEDVLNDRLNKTDQKIDDNHNQVNAQLADTEQELDDTKKQVNSNLSSIGSRVSNLENQIGLESIKLGDWKIEHNENLNSLDFRVN